ncbi:ester cyclase [Haloarcula amylovorans]|uniref:ester cyclase n=1 Tax=Haloarcula amylovorans TaxID=2562280 RepID=UPI0010765AEC|nr:ester cyclase [Halomicroarcula amylolytica]
MATPEQDNKEHARRFNEEVWGKSNLDAIDHLVADDFVGYNPARPEPLRGADGVREVAELLQAAFPDCEVELEQVLADGDWLTQRVTVSATHEGEFMGIAPTGKQVEITGISVTRFEDGKWVEGYELWDIFGLLQQLGITELPVDTTGEPEQSSTPTHSQPFSESAVENLREQARGEVLLPGGDGYDEARTIWNAMIDRRPAVSVRCAGTADVIGAVDFAREHDLLLSVKGGGHNVSGNAVCDDGIMVDLSQMTSVRVDPTAKTVRVEPGVTMADLDHETQAYGLATPGGVVSMTGVAGLTLGGGWGWLSRTYGLAIDNLRSVDIVTADGELRRVSEDENPDLFWGVRGGGGNFGIATSFEFDCYEVGPEVLAGLIVHPFEDAADLLRFHREVTAEAPDELCCYAAILTAPPEPFLPEEVHGSPVFAFALCYSGDVEEGERTVKSLRDYGDPIADLVDTYPYTAFQQILDDGYQPGVRNYWKSRFIDSLSDDAINLVLEYAESRPSPLTEILIEHQGGAITQIEPEATAYYHRDAELTFNILSRWEDPTEDEEHIEWTQQFFEAMAPYSANGVYVNFLGEEGEERVKAAYGDNYDRLVELKNTYDPDNLFRMNQNIKPTV